MFHFRTKVFFTYFAILVVVFLVLGFALGLALPHAFNRHMQGVQMGGRMQADMMLGPNLRAAANEALLLAAGAALVVALVLSAWLSSQLAAPLNAITEASREIAAGRYEKRVEVNADGEDVDEIGRLARSFNQMAAELEQTENMRRQLIGDVSHELRTPLTAIKGYSEGLMDGVLPANKDTYQHIHREADRLQRLVDDLQELSRVEAGGFELRFSAVPVASLMHTLQKRMAAPFEEKSVGLSVDVPGELPNVFGDEDRLGQVLLNLAGNALQFTPAGGQVTVTARELGDFVQFDVTDTGIGIPPEHLPHIFKRFYRADPSRSRSGGGSGIGLTIAQHLVEAHGGRIWARSEGSDKGSTFSFTIPKAKPL